MGNGESDLNRNIKSPNKKGINKWPTSYLFKHFGLKRPDSANNLSSILQIQNKNYAEIHLYI